MTENKVIPENFVVCVDFEKFTSINSVCNESQSSKSLGCDRPHATLVEVNFSKLTYNKKIFGNYFVFSSYHICKI